MEKFSFDKSQQTIYENSEVPFGVFQFFNDHVHVIAVSKGALNVFDFKSHEEAYEVFERDAYRDTHPEDIARANEEAVKFAREESTEYSLIYRTLKKGEFHIIHAHGKHIYVEGTRLAVVWYSDEGVYDPAVIDETGDMNRALNKAIVESNMYHNIRYDHLTGLPSMTYFFDVSQAAHERFAALGIPCAVVFLDLNGMKFYNRKFGLSEGDKLIRALGRLLVKYFGHDNCSRFGQDHFAVFTEEAGLLDKLDSLMKEADGLNDGNSLPLRAGVYFDKYGMVPASTACDWAKMACDQDRTTYKSHYKIFDESMLKAVENRQYIIDNIDRAIEEGWIQVYYQPIVRAANGKVCDEEALARWIDPEKGFLTPDMFIPVLEESNLIYKLDLYVTELILDKMKNQAYAGLFVVPMSVNLSRSDFDSCDIVEEIKKRVDKAGVSPEMLTIEITESVVGTDFDYIKTQVERFRSLGFKVWMDDFGSGYSSLDVLHSLKFDLIKLDMRFMQRFNEGEATKIILTELVRMAMGLGIDTVVEGVETAEQAEFLKEIGVTKLQGYHYCKPVPFDEIVARNKEGRQIGFENPDETSYYETLGRINLYDMSIVTSNDEEAENYFSGTPIALFELDKKKLKIIRGNKSYRDFFAKNFKGYNRRRAVDISSPDSDYGIGFYKAIDQCNRDGGRLIFDEELMDGSNVHVFVRKLAVNPITGVAAFVIVVLSITELSD